MFTWEWWITVPAAVTVLLVGGVAACGQTVKPVSGRGTGQFTGARRDRWPRRSPARLHPAGEGCDDLHPQDLRWKRSGHDPDHCQQQGERHQGVEIMP
jgi:hypothetical protein